MWPERFGPPELEELKKSLGPFGAAGQLQQRPSPATGGVFQRHWWRFWQPAGASLPPIPVKQPDGTFRSIEPITLPPLDETLHSWDMSYRDLKESDFVVGQHWGRAAARKFLLHQVKGRWDFSRTASEVKKLAEERPAGAKLIENAANGPAIIWALEAQVPGIIAIVPIGSKEARASAISPQVEAGNVFLPHPAIAEWVPAFINECAAFPRGANDDQVDAMSQALNRLNKAEIMRLLPEFRAHNREGEPAEACHVVRSHALDGWWLHWVAASWQAGVCYAAWFCLRPDQQLHVYREIECRGTAEEAGVAIAEASIEELQNTRSLVLFLQPDCFDAHVTGKPIAGEIAKGIENVAGRDATFTYAFTDAERAMTADQAWLSLETRRRKAQKASILLKGATGDRAGGWEHIRGLLRWWSLSTAEPIPYDRETAKKLLDEPDGQARFDEYMRHVAGEKPAEPLPGLVIHDSCQSMIAELPSLTRDEKKIDLAAPSLCGEALLAGILGYREHAEIRPPVEVFTAQRILDLRRRNPDADATQIHNVAAKAEADYERQFGKRTGWNFSRIGRART